MKILTSEGKARLEKKKILINRMNKKINDWCREHILQTAFAIMCWSMTPFMFYIADIERGYDALGGEAFVPVFPFFIYLISEAMQKDGE